MSSSLSANKNIFLSALLIVLIVCGAFLFMAHRDARRAYVAEMTMLLKSVPASEVTGVITELSGDTLTLAVDADRFGVDNPPDTLIYTITPETAIIEYVRVSSTESYAEAMSRYTEAIESDPEYRGTPPKPFEMRTLSKNDLKEGYEVSVSTGTLSDSDHILADRITLRYRVEE